MTYLPDKIWASEPCINQQYNGVDAVQFGLYAIDLLKNGEMGGTPYARITDDTIILSRKELEGMYRCPANSSDYMTKGCNVAIDDILKLGE